MGIYRCDVTHVGIHIFVFQCHLCCCITMINLAYIYKHLFTKTLDNISYLISETYFSVCFNLAVNIKLLICQVHGSSAA